MTRSCTIEINHLLCSLINFDSCSQREVHTRIVYLTQTGKFKRVLCTNTVLIQQIMLSISLPCFDVVVCYQVSTGVSALTWLYSFHVNVSQIALNTKSLKTKLQSMNLTCMCNDD